MGDGHDSCCRGSDGNSMDVDADKAEEDYGGRAAHAAGLHRCMVFVGSSIRGEIYDASMHLFVCCDRAGGIVSATWLDRQAGVRRICLRVVVDDLES